MVVDQPTNATSQETKNKKIKKLTRINEVDEEGSLRHGHKITKNMNVHVDSGTNLLC